MLASMNLPYISAAAKHDHVQCVPRWLPASALTCAETLLPWVRLRERGVPCAENAHLTGDFEHHQVSAICACRQGLLTSSAGGGQRIVRESGQVPAAQFPGKGK